MTDFESRAHAAARAIHDAMANDTPTVETHPVPRRRPTRARALLVAAAAVLVIAIVGALVVRRDDGPTAAETSELCRMLVRSQQSSETPFRDPRVRQLAPAELQDDINFLAQVGSDLSGVKPAVLQEFEQHATHVVGWMNANCYPEVAQLGAAAADQRFAPDPMPSGSQPCYVTNGSPSPPERQTVTIPSHITIYGDATLKDPWQGSLLATSVDATSLLAETGPGAGVATHPEAISGSITGTDGAGRGIEWDDRRAEALVSVLARGEPFETQLPTIADHVLTDGGNPRIDPAFVPDHFTVVYDGPVEPLIDVPTPREGATFLVNARFDGSPPLGRGVTWSGSIIDDATIRATSFFAARPRTRVIAGKRALVWDGGPGQAPETILARWRESDGVVVTAQWFDKDPSARTKGMDSLIAAMRRLDHSQWTDLAARFSYCGTLSSLGRSTAKRATSSGSGQSSSATSSTTTAVGRP